MYLDNLHLIKLVKAIKSSNMGSPRASFSPKTWSKPHMSNRQLVCGEQNISVQVGDRNLSSRDKVIVLRSNVVHLSFFIDRKSTRLNSSHVKISYAVFCLK